MIDLRGDLSPIKGKYYDLIQKDWISGLTTFIDEVLYMFMNKITLSLYSSLFLQIEIEKGEICICITYDTDISTLNTLLNNPLIEIGDWSSFFSCENQNIKQLKLDGAGIFIRNCKIESFHLDLCGKDMFYSDILHYLKEFDLTQVKEFRISNNHLECNPVIVKFLFYHGCNVNEQYGKFICSKLLQIIYKTYTNDLIDSTLFEVVDTFLS
jgi:hypothetical protein